MVYLALEDLTDKLRIWIEKKRNEIFVIDGPSQIGKTHFIKQFIKSSYFIHIYVNVKDNKEFLEKILDDIYITPENFYSSLCFHLGLRMQSGLVQLIFDGIEYCPRLRQFFKVLVEYGRINIIAISCGGLAASHYKNLLVPSEENVNHIFPMTFGEFLTAVGQDSLDAHLSNAILRHKPLSEFLSTEIFKTYKLYNLIGGYPSVVEHYVKTNDIVSCKAMNQKILIKQFAHARDLLPASDKELMNVISKYIFYAISNGTYNSIESISTYKMKQLLSFLEDEYVITMPTALDLKDTSKQSNSKRLYFFHQCFYHASNDSFMNDEYFNDIYPTETDVLTDYFFNQRNNSKPYHFGILRNGKYMETDALLVNNSDMYCVEVKTKRLSTLYNLNLSERTNNLVKPGILLFNGNVFEYEDVIVLPSYCSCYLIFGINK